MKKKKKTQEEIFLESEGDKYFERCKGHLGQVTVDPVSFLIDLYSLSPKSIIDIGCCNGWRLETLREKYKAKCVGVDASKSAIKSGRKSFHELNLETCTISDITISETFDLVMVVFVLHWASRETLLKSLSEIDRLVKPGGYLIVGDFAPTVPTKNKYQHLLDEEVWTYKDFYASMFTSIGTYYEVAKLTTEYEDNSFSAKALPESRSVYSLLKKDK